MKLRDRLLLSGAVFCYLMLSEGSLAQITPDETLGEERSRVTPNVDVRGSRADRIDGGATRGSNLFHSFRDFNVNDGQRVYFSNPAGIENILSRVTGSDVSDILGTLGVDGSANLFLLNPNGIIFGANAQLDISGSFTASTGRGFTFFDGSEFSATNPQAPPLLNVGVPIGLQYGQPVGNLSNAGGLSVTPGQTLSLFGNTVTHSGSLVAPGGTVQVLGDRIALLDGSSINVSSETRGGTVLIGNDATQGTPTLRTSVAPNASILADALVAGDGGSVILQSEAETQINGNITARGGAISGNGGFVETSGRQSLEITTSPDVSAPAGVGGTWFIDANTINIISNGTGAANPDPANPFVGIGNNTRLEVELIRNALTGGDVTISAIASETNESGNISFNAALDYDTIGVGRTLTLNADNNIAINQSIFDSNRSVDSPADSLNVVLDANRDRTGFGQVSTQFGTSISTGGGNFFARGDGDFIPGVFNGAAINSEGGDISFIGTGNTDVGILNRGELSSDGGAISLTGSSNSSDGIGIFGTTITSNNGNITLTGNSETQDGIRTSSVSVNVGTGTLTLSANRVGLSLGSIFRGSGDVLIQPLTPDGNLQFDGAIQPNNFENGFRSITIGREDGSGAITLVDDLAFSDPLTVRSPLGSGSITITDTLSADDNGTITLIANQDITTGAINSPNQVTLESLNGDIAFGDYTGASLGIATAGSITGRNITINTADVTSSGSPGSDAAILGGSSALILRAGVGVLTGDPATTGTIRIGNVETADRRSPLPPDIPVSGSVILSAYGNVETESIDTRNFFAQSVTIPPGDIRVTSNQGQINTGSLLTSSRANASSGSIALDARGDIRTDSLFSGSNASGSGGAITLTSREGSIDTTRTGFSTILAGGNSSSFGSGGAITLSAANDIRAGEINSVFTSGQGGNINLEAGGEISVGLVRLAFSGNSQSSGDLTANAGGNISIAGIDVSGRDGSGEASITSDRSIDINFISAFSSENGNRVNLTAGEDVSVSNIVAFGSAGTGGTLSFNAGRDLTIRSDILNYSSSGRGGSITSTAGRNLSVENIQSFGATGRGNVRLDAGNLLTIGSNRENPIIDSSGGGEGGNVTLISRSGDFTFTNGSINSNASSTGNGGDIEVEANSIQLTGSSLITSADVNGNAGNISLEANSNIAIENSLLNSDINGVGRSGRLQLQATSIRLQDSVLSSIISGQSNARAGGINIDVNRGLELERSRLSTSLELGATGRSGAIDITAGSVSLSDFSLIDTATFGNGDAGTVSINARNAVSLNNSSILSLTNGQGNSGEVSINVDDVTLSGRSVVSTAVDRNSQGIGGDINVEANTVRLRNGGQFISSTFSSGRAGNINILARDRFVARGTAPLIPSSGNGTFGGEAEVIDENRLIDADPATVNPDVEFSNRVPYASIPRSNADLYQFEVRSPGTRAIFDIDNGLGYINDVIERSDSVNTEISLFDSSGNLLVSNDDAPVVLGAGGSVSIQSRDPVTESVINSINSTDSYARYTFREPGTYFLQVSTPQGNLNPTASYTLQLSLEPPSVEGLTTGDVLASGVFARTQGTGRAGNVTITTPTFTLGNSANISTTSATAVVLPQVLEGRITINSDRVNLSGQGSGLFATTEGSTPAGSINLNPYGSDGGDRPLTINLSDGAAISASTSNSGFGGSLNVVAPGAITISGNGELSSETTGTGDGGDIFIRGRSISLLDRVQLSTSSTNPNAAPGMITIRTTDDIRVNNGSEISSSGAGTGIGTIELLSEEGSAFLNDATLNTSNVGSAIAGRIVINVPDEILINNSRIFSDGNFGQLSIGTNSSIGQSLNDSTLEARPDQVVIRNSQLSTTNGNAPEFQAGNIDLAASDRIQVVNSEISSNTVGTGLGGSIQFTGSQTLNLIDSVISAETSGAGSAGDITMRSQRINILDGTDISASTDGLGQGGEISIIAPDSVRLVASELSAETDGAQGAGDIRVETGRLTLRANTSGEEAEITTSTEGSGRAGNITLNVENDVEILNSTIFSTSGVSDDEPEDSRDESFSEDFGDAGTVTLDAGGSVLIRGTFEFGDRATRGEREPAGLSVEAIGGGRAGNLIVNADQLRVEEGASLTVSSPDGQAGDLEINADSVILNNGTLTAEAGQGNGGNITVTASGSLLRLINRNQDALISAEAISGADGGRITLNVRNGFVLVNPNDDADVLASAAGGGNGGRIEINTYGIFGIEERNPRSSLTSDLNASSDVGVGGTIDLNTLGIDPTRGLTELPETVEPPDQVARGCGTGSETVTDVQGSFVVTGRGGLPPHPGDVLNSEPVGDDWVALDETAEPETVTVSPVPGTQPLTEIVEAQGWIINDKGEIEAAIASSSTPQDAVLSTPTCSVTNPS
jgi:filamentous hemagglutinin family protein